jgi:predicted transcriptional regulator
MAGRLAQSQQRLQHVHLRPAHTLRLQALQQRVPVMQYDDLKKLSQIARNSGTDTEHLVQDAALRLVEEDARFRAAVQRGIEQANRGELLDHNEVVARIERLLQP